MKIKTMDLTGFGKFQNKTVELEDGINIIYGENESGKTTIHSFIDGMFYGFLRPNVKSVRYLEEHDLYDPWDNNRYMGIISFIYKEQEYRIERGFSKSKEYTKIYLESTGEEVTDAIDAGNRTRILQPGYHFFGFNSRVFRNTISVKQLKTKTESELSKEIKEKLVNASHALDEKISVKEAIKNLDKDLKDIGSERAPTSTYGRAVSHIHKLRDKIREISGRKDEYINLLNQSESLEEQLESKSELLKDMEYLELKNIYEKGISLKKGIDDLEKSIKTLSQYKNLNEDDCNEIKDKINELNLIENSQGFKNSTKEKLENNILDLGKNIEDVSDDKYDEITKDYLDLEIMEEERNKLVNYDPKGAKSLYSEKLIKYQKNRKNALIASGVVFILTFLSLLMEVGMAFGIGFFTLIILGILIYSSSRQIKKEIKSIEYELITKKIEDIDNEKDKILKKHNVKYLAKLKDLYEGIKYKKFKKDEIEEDIRKAKRELDGLNLEINDLKEKRNLNLKAIDNLLKKNNVLTIEDFENGLKYKRDYEKKHSQIEDKKILYKGIMDNHTLESLSEKLQGYTPKNDVEIESKESLKSEVSNLSLQIARNEANLNHWEKELDTMILLEEELREKENLIDEMNKEIAAIELAKSTIEELSKNIHQDFAPDINNRVSDMIHKITKGKYSNIKIDDKLELGITNPESKELLKIDSLSGGTIDQLYFSLRCGIISSISDENLPLILDDCFVQYDDKRLKNVLELLREISDERQIILFTCHNREKELLEELDTEYNLVNL